MRSHECVPLANTSTANCWWLSTVRSWRAIMNSSSTLTLFCIWSIALMNWYYGWMCLSESWHASPMSMLGITNGLCLHGNLVAIIQRIHLRYWGNEELFAICLASLTSLCVMVPAPFLTSTILRILILRINSHVRADIELEPSIWHVNGMVKIHDLEAVMSSSAICSHLTILSLNEAPAALTCPHIILSEVTLVISRGLLARSEVQWLNLWYHARFRLNFTNSTHLLLGTLNKRHFDLQFSKGVWIGTCNFFWKALKFILHTKVSWWRWVLASDQNVRLWCWFGYFRWFAHWHSVRRLTNFFLSTARQWNVRILNIFKSWSVKLFVDKFLFFILWLLHCWFGSINKTELFLDSDFTLGASHAISFSIIGQFADDKRLEHGLLRADTGVETSFRIWHTFARRIHFLTIKANINLLVSSCRLNRWYLLPLYAGALLSLNRQGLLKSLHHLHLLTRRCERQMTQVLVQAPLWLANSWMRARIRPTNISFIQAATLWWCLPGTYWLALLVATGLSCDAWYKLTAYLLSRNRLISNFSILVRILSHLVMTTDLGDLCSISHCICIRLLLLGTQNTNLHRILALDYSKAEILG